MNYGDLPASASQHVNLNVLRRPCEEESQPKDSRYPPPNELLDFASAGDEILVLCMQNNINRKILCKMLQKLQLTAVEAETTTQAIELFKSNPRRWNTIIADIAGSSPSEDFAIMREIRALEGKILRRQALEDCDFCAGSVTEDDASTFLDPHTHEQQSNGNQVRMLVRSIWMPKPEWHSEMEELGIEYCCRVAPFSMTCLCQLLRGDEKCKLSSTSFNED
jgi:CheY-like chemotaxis protein